MQNFFFKYLSGCSELLGTQLCKNYATVHKTLFKLAKACVCWHIPHKTRLHNDTARSKLSTHSHVLHKTLCILHHAYLICKPQSHNAHFAPLCYQTLCKYRSVDSFLTMKKIPVNCRFLKYVRLTVCSLWNCQQFS